jgi:ribosome-binding factor A
MESTRQQKVGRLLQKEFSELFQRESVGMFQKAFITVTGVRVTPDLSFARVYLSVFAVPDKDKLLEHIRSQGKEIRKRIADKVAKQLRIVPNFEYYIDDSLDYAERIDELLKK